MLKQNFAGQRGSLVRSVEAGALKGTSRITGKPESTTPVVHQWWTRQLRGRPVKCDKIGSIRTLDLFSGVGGLSVGASKAIEAVGMNHIPLAAVDTDIESLKVYNMNFPSAIPIASNVASMVDFHVYGRGESAEFAYAPEIVDSRLENFIGRVDLALAGPPCQGHSNLNNHTRRSDPRNMLYLSAVAAAISLKSQLIVIENVADVLADRIDVVATAKALLVKAGYFVSDTVLNAIDLGGAQTRKRHFLVCTSSVHLSLEKAALILKQPQMTLREVIGDLVDANHDTFMDEIPILSAENKARIAYLFKHRLYDLPNKVRPDCHKSGHTYPSVYGRLRWDKPAQTITTGFMSPGRGRYIHPSERRVITAREAARIQGFPDNFVFGKNDEPPLKKSLSKWIGDAVPMWLGYSAVLTAFTSL